jgi:integrase
VDIDRGVVRLWTSKRRGGNRESRTIALSDTLKEIFSRLNGIRTGGEVYVFTNPRTGLGYTRQSREMKYLFQRVCAKAEVPLFTAHCLRHFVATPFNDPRRAQKILGHENLKTTEIYLHDLGVDMGAADIFESITHEITHSENYEPEKKSAVLQ